MKAISPALQAHLDSELTTLADVVKITRTDGVVKAFTTHDADLTVEGVLYKADGAFSAEALDSGLGLKAGAGGMQGLLDSALIAEDDLKAGLYDHARVDVAVVNWADVGMGTVPLRRGWLGEVRLEGGQYAAELRGLHDLLQRTVGECYTPECRYDLGDARCGVSLAAHTVTGSVTDALDPSRFRDSSRAEPDGWFAYGKLTWTSGANAGLSVEVQGWNASTFTLWLPMPHPISIGDAYSVHRGCDKRFATCRGVFGNAANFGGFPHLPGVGRVLGYA